MQFRSKKKIKFTINKKIFLNYTIQKLFLFFKLYNPKIYKRFVFSDKKNFQVAKRFFLFQEIYCKINGRENL